MRASKQISVDHQVYQSFGLTGPPFAVAPDPRFAYASTDHQGALTKVAYSVANRRGLFLMQGEIGTGKTTLGRFLLANWAREPQRYRAALLNSPTTRSQAGFLREVMKALDLPTTRNLNDLEGALLDVLLKAREAGQVVVVVLDEAQTIPVPGLNLLHRLSNMQSVEDQLLQIVLLAQPNIVNKLDQAPALRSRITGGAYLGPLSFEDAVEMLRHRMDVVGGDFDALFLPETHKPLYNATAGIPRDLCVAADGALVEAFAQGKKAVDSAALTESIRPMSFKGWVK